MQVEALVGLSLFNYQDDTQSNKHKIGIRSFAKVLLKLYCLRWKLCASSIVFQRRLAGLNGVIRN